MPLARASNADGKRVWELMTSNFRWSRDSLTALRISLRSGTHAPRAREVKLQLFEVVVAAVFARLRPDYDWWVTPNLPDAGVDFVGRGAFLTSKELGIDAAITIGGQCKKREHVKDVVGELSGSLLRMAEALHPTFFVAALSASLTAKRIAEATRTLENTLQRHCHILDRRQLEGLIAANLAAVSPVIQEALSKTDAEYLLAYFGQQPDRLEALTVRVVGPTSVLAGEPFRVRIRLSRRSLAADRFNLGWKPPHARSAAMLLAPPETTTLQGLTIDFGSAGRESPFTSEVDLEFMFYAVGAQSLGTIAVQQLEYPAAPVTITELPSVMVIENLRPPFYAVPYREPLDELRRGMLQAQAGKVSCVAVVGAGGAGKTRLCQEMSLDARRHGAYVVSARQAHSTEFPRRILANLLLGLAETSAGNDSASLRIDRVLSHLEPNLAIRARSAIEALCGQAGAPGSSGDDQSLLSVFLVLIAQQSRLSPVIIHLHDLHWCTLDVLETLDRLIWQLDHLEESSQPGGAPTGLRVLFLLEGRMHEHRQEAETGWSTRMYERFIGRLSCPVARCRSFEPHESAAFTQRLFEQPHSAQPVLPRALLGLQQELIDTVHRVAGGNPLHLLEQIKLLQQHGILAQNPRTGLIYMVLPDFRSVKLPPTVLETIAARWQYYWVHDRQLAILLWASALVDDNLPAALFRHLWSRLASGVTQGNIESTEFIRFPADSGPDLQVSFRHENYFQTVRSIQLPAADRQAVVDAYLGWFDQQRRLSPALRYVQARVELESPTPRTARVRSLLRLALRGAAARHDRTLEARILATLLDAITWPENLWRPLASHSLVRACDDELALCTILTRAGRSDVAFERLERGLAIVEQRLRDTSLLAADRSEGAWERRFALLAMKAEILFHDRRPAEALAITQAAVDELASLMRTATASAEERWQPVLMEMQHTHSAALAFAGELKRAVVEARSAASIAEKLIGTSSEAVGVLITYANILLCEAPIESESVLERCLIFTGPLQEDEGTKLRLTLNLAMARMVVQYQEGPPHEKSARLTAAHESLLLVFRRAHPLGRLKDAAAASLLLGVIHALWCRGDEIDWFSQATSLAARARQLETLWRAHINLAHSLFLAGQSPHDAAAAALELMMFSLDAYAEPDRTPRFQLLAVPLAHAVRYLMLANDERAERALGQYPALRSMFSNLATGELKVDRDGRVSHEWFRVGAVDYVIY
ncbi:MAG TPA: AAA family ATPase [Thermoanaerobaculia bacterium]|nr:AAA family ATPase [Thermoanaerobaculia bacterium]